MDEKDFIALALVRLDRAKELYTEANELVKMDSYKNEKNMYLIDNVLEYSI